MKNIIILELLLAFLILLLGESLFDIRKEEFQGETLKIAYTKDIGDVDPFDSGSPMFVQDWVYEGLVGRQNHGKLPMMVKIIFFIYGKMSFFQMGNRLLRKL